MLKGERDENEMEEEREIHSNVPVGVFSNRESKRERKRDEEEEK